MADQTGTLDSLAAAVTQLLLPLEEVLVPERLPQLFVELGLDTAPAVGGDAQFGQKLADVIAALADLPGHVDALIEAAEAEDTGQILAGTAQLIEDIAQLTAKLDAVANDLKRAAAGDPKATAFAEVMVERLLDYAVIRYLEMHHPLVLSITNLLGLTELAPALFTADGKSRLIFRRLIYSARIAQLFQDPLVYLETTYGWGTNALQGDVFFERIIDVLLELNVLTGTTVDDSEQEIPGLDLFGLSVVPRTDVQPTGLRAFLFADLAEDLKLTIAQLSEHSRVDLELKGAFGAGLTADLLPPARLEILAGGPTEDGLFVRLVAEDPDPARPYVIFGSSGGSRLQVKHIGAAIGATARWESGSNRAVGELAFDLEVVDGKLVVDTSKSDSFLSKLLPSDGLTLSFGFSLGWAAERGVYFKGAAALEFAFALDLAIGPFSIDTIHLLIGLATDKLRLEASLDGSGAIGPVSASVERIGVEADLAFHRGNLGPVDLGIGFKFPAGLGINIDAGPITGGGFIEFDHPNGRYAGVLALSLYSIQIKAIGLLDTKLPNGESGYSFLIIISVEFTPIQLGFGFTLNGVGGLCGINRDFVTDALQAGLRAHSLDHILFPKDPVKNAPAIISDLRVIFPPAEGRYVFGPMIELGWGGGLNLVTAEFGIILAIPSPVIIAILGQLNVNVPNPAAPVIELHLDVLGIIDFGKKLFSLDASLHDSRIVIFTIYGDMAMRLSWGDHPSFALSIGGLNPHFQPPDGFPQLRRLTIALSYSDNFRLSIQTYFAITSNSFQFGAHAELYIGVSAFNVYGWLGFDALFIFTPFSFIVDFTAGLALRSGTSTLLGISLDGELSGPTPWHAVGNAHVTLLFFEISCHVDIKWGEDQQSNPPLVDAWQPLRDAIANVQNWSGGLPSGVPAPVTLAAPKPGDQTIYVLSLIHI